ncbi:GNAT family N-acetyltransferase [Sphingopyxis sp. MWB1]|uniref:GNAT family N-acetyltransferase n=1 Tax=Sphingopyxis sp. MWB1 TaxID=1537715 RepID=UPI0009DEEF45|nr:GNAT family N-acetyltransferase [Sphingopyxis sp. MWB1]
MARPSPLARLVRTRRAPGRAGMMHAPSTLFLTHSAPVIGPCQVRLIPPGQLGEEDRARWAQLSRAADEGNIFAQHWFMDAALTHAPREEDVHLAVVQDRHGRWIGALPLFREKSFGRWPVRIWTSWLSTNQFLGTPLLLPDHGEFFWRQLFAHLDSHSEGEILLFLRQLAFDDSASAALFAHCAATGRPVRMTQRHERPARRPDAPEGAPGDRKTASRLRGLRRKLERDHGKICIDIIADGQNIEQWVDQFLPLEKSGWKGRRGSALGCDQATEALFRNVMQHGQGNGSLRLASLRAGGKDIAMTSWFETRTHGYGFKMAFDEAYRRYAPGQQLMQEIAAHIARRAHLYFDTCAPEGTTSYHKLWPHRRMIFDAAIALGSTPRRLAFETLMNARTFYANITAPWRRI